MALFLWVPIFRGLNKSGTFVGFKILGHSNFFHNSYRKSPFRGYWNSWIRPSTKTTKIGMRRKFKPSTVMHYKITILFLNLIFWAYVYLDFWSLYSQPRQHSRCCRFHHQTRSLPVSDHSHQGRRTDGGACTRQEWCMCQGSARYNLLSHSSRPIRCGRMYEIEMVCVSRLSLTVMEYTVYREIFTLI